MKNIDAGLNWMEVTVSEQKYVQIKLSEEERWMDACRLCCARFDEPLCNTLACFCWPGFVFQKKIEE